MPDLRRRFCLTSRSVTQSTPNRTPEEVIAPDAEEDHRRSRLALRARHPRYCHVLRLRKPGFSGISSRSSATVRGLGRNRCAIPHTTFHALGNDLPSRRFRGWRTPLPRRNTTCCHPSRTLRVRTQLPCSAFRLRPRPTGQGSPRPPRAASDRKQTENRPDFTPGLAPSDAVDRLRRAARPSTSAPLPPAARRSPRPRAPAPRIARSTDRARRPCHSPSAPNGGA